MKILNKVLAYFTFKEEEDRCRTCGVKVYFPATINPIRCPSCVNYWTAVMLNKTRTPLWKYLENKNKFLNNKTNKEEL